MAIAMNGSSGNRRQQWWWHDCNGQWRLRCNGRRDSGAITMCGVAIALDGGGGNGETVAIDNGNNSAMDGGMVAQLQWVMVAAMGDSKCHNGRRRQRRNNPDGRQWWRHNGCWDSCAIVMAIAMNSGCRDRRQQWQRHRNEQWQLQRNGQRDGGTIAMRGVAITMDSGSGDGRWLRDESEMGDCNGAGTIAMGNGGSSAMDGRMMVRL